MGCKTYIDKNLKFSNTIFINASSKTRRSSKKWMTKKTNCGEVSLGVIHLSRGNKKMMRTVSTMNKIMSSRLMRVTMTQVLQDYKRWISQKTFSKMKSIWWCSKFLSKIKTLRSTIQIWTSLLESWLTASTQENFHKQVMVERISCLKVLLVKVPIKNRKKLLI